ncbi:MAG: hypothetical protein IIA91_04570 [Chloroflexi bacterium]|nr:hypothetical protein [Chloroflexota bacterium]
MKLELDQEESVELLSLIVDRITQEAKLATKDRATVKRWRSEQMKAGSDAMKELTDKINADLEHALQTKAKSAVQRADWR